MAAEALAEEVLPVDGKKEKRMNNKVKKWFSPSDQEEIIEAVKQAEKLTSGEIAPLITYKSGNYNKPLFLTTIAFSTLLTITGIILWYFLGEMIQLRYKLNSFTLVSISALLPILLLILFYDLLTNLSFLKKIFIPKSVLKRRVLEQAEIEFYRQGIANTVDRTGILIYISIFERQVVILADAGINEKVSKDFWADQVQIIVEGLKQKEGAKALIKVIEQCKGTLAKEFPIKANDTDELSNLIIK